MAGKLLLGVVLGAIVASSAGSAPPAHAAPLMVVGLDEKLTWDEHGKRVLSPPGRDSLLIVDLAKPEAPKIVAKLALENSVSGPPTNVAIAPDNSIALVADAQTVVTKGGGLDLVPTDKLFVVDLKAKPPKLAQTLTVGRQPSGLSFSPRGHLALVAYRADDAIGVFKVEHGRVREIGRVPVGGSVAHVVFTPDGRHALAVKTEANKVAVLDIDGDKVTYSKVDLPAGRGPYNIDVSPDGQVAAATAGPALSLLDLRADPPSTEDPVGMPSGGEGVAFSPKGGLAAVASMRGSANRGAVGPSVHGAAVILRVDGAKLTPVQEIEVGATPEAIGFTPDGRYIYVGDYLDQDISILRVDGGHVVDTGKRFKTPGHPASARISPR